MPVIRIIPAHFNHFSDLCVHNKECAAVHARNRVIDDNDLLASVPVCVFPSKYKLLEI